MSERKPTEVIQRTQAFTPAPWSISLIEDDYGNVSYSIDIPHRYQPQSEHDANSRLIAAAPDLLAAAKALIEQADRICQGDIIETSELEAAIAKAEGR